MFSLVIFLGCSFSFGADDNIANLSNNLSKNDTYSTTSSSQVLAAGDSKPEMLSQNSILHASSTVNNHVSKYGKLPNYVAISGYNFSMPELTYLLSTTIQNKYENNNSPIIIKYGVKNPSSPLGENISGKIYSKTYYNYAVSVTNFIKKHNVAPNYLNTSLGKIQYQTLIHGFSKILAWSNSNKNRLPSYLILNIKKTSTLNKNLPKYTSKSSKNYSKEVNTNNSKIPSKVSQKSLWVASKNVHAFVYKYGKLPNYVTISNSKYSMPEFMYLLSKAIAYKYLRSNSNVPVKYNVKNPSYPSGVSINKNISKFNYYNLVRKTYSYIESTNKAPNYLAFKRSNIKYQTVIYGLSKIGIYIGDNNKLPSYLSLNVKSSSPLNRYIPVYFRSGNSINNKSIDSNNTNNNNNLNSNKNAIWLWSSHINTANLDSLNKNGIGNIFVHEDIFKNKEKALKWISTAKNKGINIHIWISCFYNTTTGKWISPVNKSTNKVNQMHFNTIINKAKGYAVLPGVSGIHLDYLRHSTGSAAITEFVRQLSTNVKSLNSKIIFSAAIMPEKDGKYSYGQDTNQLGKYLNVLVPMIYKGNYKSAYAGSTSSAWISSITKWFVANSGGAEIWGGLQTYKSDSDITRLSASELASDAKNVLNSGSKGVALFRWGLVNLFNFSNI